MLKSKYYAHYILLFSIMLQHYTTDNYIRISSVNLYIPDFLTTILYILFIPNLLNDSRFSEGIYRNKSIIVLIVLYLIPTIVGLINNYRLEAILRDSVLPYFLLSLYIFIYLIRDADSILKILDFIVVVSFWGGIYHIICLSFGITFESGMSNVVTSHGTISRGYGIGSIWPFYSISMIHLIVNYTYVSMKKAIHKYRAFLIIFFSMLVLATYVRTYYVATLTAIAIVIILKRPDYLRAFVKVSLIALMLLVVFYYALPQSVLNVYERMRSIVEPSYSSTLAYESYMNRIQQIKVARQYIGSDILFGKGAGHFTANDRKISSHSIAENRLLVLLTHNSYSHIYVVGGLFLLVTLIVYYLSMVLQVVRLYFKTGDNKIKDICIMLIGVFAFIFIISFASGATIFGPYYVFIIPWLGITHSLLNFYEHGKCDG